MTKSSVLSRTRSRKEYRMQASTLNRMELSPKERLLAHSAQVLSWLDDPAARLFSEWLKDVRLRENKKLMESKDTVDVHRAQGSIGIIDLVSGLKDDLR